MWKPYIIKEISITQYKGISPGWVIIVTNKLHIIMKNNKWKRISINIFPAPSLYFPIFYNLKKFILPLDFSNLSNT
jgi:hypothetical protein